MQAVVCRQLEGPSALELAEMPSPDMGAGEVRVRVRAAGVNFPDILMMEGKYQVKPRLPFIPGLEVAGEVMECGAGVSHVQPGDRVMAFARSGGAYATEVVLPGGIVTPIPEDMDFVTAAAFPVAYGTAHFALADRGHLSHGETLAVLGAGGGVGLAAVELGKMLGARVIAAARGADKLAVATAHGADEVIDYESEDLRERLKALTDGKGVDVLFDPVGGTYCDQSVRAMGWEGRMLIIGFASGDFSRVPTNMVLVKNFSVVGVVFGAESERFPDSTRARWTSLFPHYSSGALRPRVWKTFALADVRKALEAITEREVKGKMVITL